MKTTMMKDLNDAVSQIKITPEMRKALGYIGLGMVVCAVLFFGLPWVVEQCWNGFFAFVFHLPRFSYTNSLSLLFWIALFVGLVVLVKD